MIEIIIIRLFENSSCVDTMISIKFFYITYVLVFNQEVFQ